jgi:LysM repeat protein
MSKWPASWRAILLFVFCCILSGCLPNSDSPIDDEKDPNFVEGRTHENMMDWPGAVEAFERAIQANPRNAAAHFELGVLYQEKMNDPLNAAYHYNQHLKLRPNSEYRETVKDRLIRCKMDMGKMVDFKVIGADIHKDLAKLTNELALSKQYNEQLRAQLAAKPTVITQWMKFTVTNTVQVPVPATNTVYQAPRTVMQTPAYVAPTNASHRVTPLPAATNSSNIQRRAEQRPSSASPQLTQRAAEFRNSLASTPASARARTYVVKPGETMAEVARRTGVTLPKLQAANPTIEPRRLRAGQTLNIPSQ